MKMSRNHFMTSDYVILEFLHIEQKDEKRRRSFNEELEKIF